jgi:hypothetical protein
MPCPICGVQVSRQAQACPSCGHPLASMGTPATAGRGRIRTIVRWVIASSLLLIIGLIVLGLTVGGKTQRPATAVPTARAAGVAVKPSLESQLRERYAGPSIYKGNQEIASAARDILGTRVRAAQAMGYEVTLIDTDSAGRKLYSIRTKLGANLDYVIADPADRIVMANFVGNIAATQPVSSTEPQTTRPSRP